MSDENRRGGKDYQAADLQKQQDTGTAHRTGKLGNREGWVRKGGEIEVSGLFIFSRRRPGDLGT